MALNKLNKGPNPVFRLFKGVGGAINENLKSAGLRLEGYNEDKRLENDLVETFLEMAQGSGLTQADVDQIVQSDWFIVMEKKNQDKFKKTLDKRVRNNLANEDAKEQRLKNIEQDEKDVDDRNTESENRREVNDTMIENINEALDDAAQEFVDEEYEKAITLAMQAKEQIIRKQKVLFEIKRILNATVLKGKRLTEIFSKTKSNMTTVFLPDAMETILKERLIVANTIIGEAAAKLKQQTKDRKVFLNNPGDAIKEVPDGFKAHYKGSFIVAFSRFEKVLQVKNRIGKGDDTIYVVQEGYGKRSFALLNQAGDPVIPEYIKELKVEQNRILYKKQSDSPREVFDLQQPQQPQNP